MEIKELVNKVNCYEKQIADMKAHIDYLKAELQEAKSYSDKLKYELELKDGSKMFDTLMENSSGEAKELLSRHLYENLCCVEINREKLKLELPTAPIDVAAMIIRETVILTTSPIQKAFNLNAPEEYEAVKYSTKDLKEIAEHLLVYCNCNADGD